MSAPEGFTAVRSPVSVEQLCHYLTDKLNEEVGRLDPNNVAIWQANNGMSNPTYLLYATDKKPRKLIIRRKPSGKDSLNQNQLQMT